jgi:hypothetical protein
MFTEHTHHTAACVECGAAATENQYADGGSLPLFIFEGDDLDEIELSTWDGDWIELYDGRLLCGGCAGDREPDSLDAGVGLALREALTPGVHYHLCCDQCSKTACEADGDDFPLVWTDPVMTELSASGMRVDGWRVDGSHALCRDCVLVSEPAGGLSSVPIEGAHQ